MSKAGKYSRGKPWFKPKIKISRKEDQKESISYDTKPLIRYIKRNEAHFLHEDIKEKSYFMLNYKSLTQDEEFMNEWQDFETDILQNPDDCLRSLELAMQEVLSDYVENPPIPFCRLFNLGTISQLKHIRANSYNKLISIRGTVIKASAVKMLGISIEFKCDLCGHLQIIKQLDGEYVTPNRCKTKECKSNNFAPQTSSVNTTTSSYQIVKLQELEEDEQRENGRIPRTIECEFTDDLTRICLPGDDIVVTGITRARNTTDDTLFSLYLSCVSVINQKADSDSRSRIHFDTTDYYAIQKIHSEENIFQLLVHSLCPSIFGHEVIKAGLILALFGGTQNNNGKRDGSHVLLVGDPGLGKSQLLQACCNVSPRGVYVCGNTSTGSGLTVTVVKESKGEFGLEGGALVLADQGCCCIDEFDKMRSQHACLLEVMEQQSISIAKAGMTRSLPIRTSVLAAANPAGGHYDKSKTVAENLKISQPLLSRFDLVFIILDEPNERIDGLLTEHVLALHSGRKPKKSADFSITSSSSDSLNETLRHSLLLGPNDEFEPLPHVLFRKYVAYAQRYVNPKLNQKAKEVLTSFYLELRGRYQAGDSTPITARQLESLQRLTQARAKLELREEANERDAREVVEIMRHSMANVFVDEHGTLDFTRSPNGAGLSGKKQIMKFLNVLQRRSETTFKSVFNVGELREVAAQAGVAKDKFYGVLQSLNVGGFLLMRGGNNYKLVSTDF